VGGNPATGGVPALSATFVAAMRARAEDAGVTEVAWLLEPAHALPGRADPDAGRADPVADRRGALDLPTLQPDVPGAAGVAVPSAAEVDVRVLAGTRELAGSALLDAVAVMDRLRSPGGCPWDAEQTHASLAPYLLEEAYEAYQAIEDGNLAELREELGDVLLQVLFHARVAAEGAGGG
jgi:XTP/dITP diphosphohydrolase